MAFLEFVFGKKFDSEANVFTLNLEGRKPFHFSYTSEAESLPQQGEARTIKIVFATEYAYKS